MLLLLEKLDNMCVVIIYCLVCGIFFWKNESPTLKLKEGQFNKDQEQPPEVYYKKSCS